MHAAISILQELARELRTLLSQLGAEAGGTWQASWGRCQALFDRYHASEPDLATLPQAEATVLTAVLTEVVRLGIRPDKEDGTMNLPANIDRELQQQAVDFVLANFPKEMSAAINQAKKDWLRPA